MRSQDDAIEAILGPDVPADPHPHGERPRVVLFGDYNSGKTSLIRRLLAEDGTPVPSWLTVGPEPETFQPGEIASGGFVYVDTPGMSARSTTEHEHLALDTLGSADLVMLLLAGQPGSEALKQMTGLAERGFTGETTLVVITRYDSGMGDPEKALDECLALLEKRKQALRALLPEALAGAEIRPAVADPLGKLAGKRPPGPRYFAPYRSWDGITELRARLARLPGQLPQLRAAAARRHRLATVTLARVAAHEQRAVAEAVIAEAETRRDRAALLRQRLAGTDAAAAEALRMAIEPEVTAVVRSAAGLDSEELKTAAEDRLRTALTGWEHTWSDRLAELAREAERDLLLEQIRPAAVSFDAWASHLPVGPGQASPASPRSPGIMERVGDPLSQITGSGIKLGSRLTDVEGKLKEADRLISARSGIKKLAGKYLDRHTKARDTFKILGLIPAEVIDENHAGIVQRYESAVQQAADSVLADSPFESFRQVDRAKRWLGNLDLAGEVVAPAMSLAGLAADVRSGKRAERADHAHRAREQQVTAEITARLAAQILGDEASPAPGTWRVGVVKLRDFLADDPLLEPAVAQAKDRIAVLDEAIRNL